MIEPGLTDKVVIITGANNPYGIGAATAQAFAAQRAKVMLHFFRRRVDETPHHEPDNPGVAFYLYQQTKSAGRIVQQIRDSGGTAECWEGDLSEAATVPALFNRTEEAFGPVDVLVNNAAFNLPDTFVPREQLSGDDLAGGGERAPRAVTANVIDRHFAVNARAVALMMAEFARRRTAQGATWGRIINVSTDAADNFGREVSYGASKHALESYSRSAAGELGRFGITVNIVAPGPIQTGYIPAESAGREERRTPLGRTGTPEDVADVIVFLASEQARWLTGQLLYIGGGHKMGV